MCVFLFGGCQSSDGTESSAAEKNSSTVSQSDKSDTSKQDDKSVVSQSNTETKSDSGTSDGTKTLVVYFSRTGEQYGVGNIDKGNTAIVAEMITEKTGADSFEILPKEDYYPYTYDELTDVAKQEQNDNARPEIKGTTPELSKYDTLFIGAPVWWGTYPMGVMTQLEKLDFTGKKVFPVMTHEGSGLEGSKSALRKYCKGAKLGKGLAVRGADVEKSEDKIKKWAEKELSI